MEDLSSPCLSSSVLFFLGDTLVQYNFMPFPIGLMTPRQNNFAGSHSIYLNLWFNPEEKREADEVSHSALLFYSISLFIYLKRKKSLFLTPSLPYALYFNAQNLCIKAWRMRWVQRNSPGPCTTHPLHLLVPIMFTLMLGSGYIPTLLSLFHLLP